MFTGTPKGRITWGQFEAERRVPEDHFLMRINELIDLSPIEKALWEVYSDGMGRPAYPPLVLFKILLLQRFYNLSDVQVVEQLRYNFLFMRFVGLTLSDNPPDDTTIVRFRDRIEDRKILSNGLAFINGQLERMGLLIKEGAVIDGTLVQAAVGPKAESKDPDARTTVREKGRGKNRRREIVHGYNVGAVVDKGTGFITRIMALPANAHDINFLDLVNLEGTKELYGDKGFADEKRKQRLREQGVKPRLMFKGKRNRKLSSIERYHNKRWTGVRYIVEQTIAGMKRYCGLSRMMWMGLARAQLQAELSAIAFNCKRAMKLLCA